MMKLEMPLSKVFFGNELDRVIHRFRLIESEAKTTHVYARLGDIINAPEEELKKCHQMDKSHIQLWKKLRRSVALDSSQWELTQRTSGGSPVLSSGNSADTKFNTTPSIASFNDISLPALSTSIIDATFSGTLRYIIEKYLRSCRIGHVAPVRTVGDLFTIPEHELSGLPKFGVISLQRWRKYRGLYRQQLLGQLSKGIPEEVKPLALDARLNQEALSAEEKTALSEYSLSYASLSIAEIISINQMDSPCINANTMTVLRALGDKLKRLFAF